ncbi:hypothetical protein Shyhy01_51390 [Streptomyces hygroscopicus subsp. hygroscopicus]|nr:hypothetical protein Shyhy01_51390 [Streptomyces hygroscopicus subsp. hygroscopicus]
MQAVVASEPRTVPVLSGSSPPRSGCTVAMTNSLPNQGFPRYGLLNCKDPYSCCLLPAYGANGPGITKQAEDGSSAAVGGRGVGLG